MIENEDIRWHNLKENRKCTYIETLAAEVEHHNPGITKRKWAEIEKMLPTITEEEAKKQCFAIRDEIRSEHVGVWIVKSSKAELLHSRRKLESLIQQIDDRIEELE